MRKIFKSEKGVNLVTLSVSIIIIISIVGIVLYNVRTNLGIQKLQAMQTDIENLRGKVSNYYLQYGALPILKPEISESVLIDNVKIVENSNIDTGKYYIIDLSAIENLTLTYGEDYEEIKDESESNVESLKDKTLTDIYVINSVSHNIFYVAGIKYEGKMYYKEYQDTENNDVGIEGFDFTNVETSNWSPTYPTMKKYKDKNDDTAVIPEGFQVSRKSGEDTIEKGLVVIDSNENEWVWIPVSKEHLELMYEENSSGWQMSIEAEAIYSKYITKSTMLGNTVISRDFTDTNYREPDVLSYAMSDANIANYKDILGFSSEIEMAKRLRDDYKEMIDSIRKNGGFYVGRYELGKDENDNPQLKKGTVMNNTNWYNLYKACSSFSNENLESRMIWGCQWDQVCRFVNEHGDKVSLDDSRSYGNFSDSTVSEDICGPTNFNNTTGRSEYWKANNIYDIAGNCLEYTQEASGVSSRVYRGGEYRRTGSERKSITYCSSNDANDGKVYIATRPVLYFK